MLPDLHAVLDSARTLKRSALAGSLPASLRGKNVGLLCDSEAAAEAVLFRRAAADLGARVSYIRPTLTEQSSPEDVQHTARLLGRLYDAVEIQGLPPALVREVGHAAGVPVYDRAAGDDHPTARLAPLLGNDTSDDDNRRFVLQAVLLSSMAG
jgi:ornithine carbamoyltransferase